RARPSRRGLLRAGAVSGGAAVAMAVGGAAGARALAADVASGGAASAAGYRPLTLFAQPDMNFEVLFTLGAAGYGASEVGEVVTAVSEVNARGASFQSLFDVFRRLAERLSKQADEMLAAGHKVSARGAYLRAASYYDVCLFFVLGTRAHAHEASVYARMQHNWDRAAGLFDPPFEPVRIPYAGTWLPGYFLRPPGERFARPTVILNNGSDAQNVDLYVYGGAAALERGYNALIFEGPGQGSMLFERQIPYRTDWQHVVSPIVDWLSARHDVDSQRIAITGWSMCGESVVQAAAFDHRLAAVVADPGVLDVWKAWPASVRKLMASGASKAEVNHIWRTDVIPHLNATDRFILAKRSELFGRRYLLTARAGRMYTDLYDLAEILMRVNCEPTAPKVASPTLVTEYQDDAFFGSHQQAGPVFRLLPDGIRKQLHSFTVAHGAEFHDAPMAPQTRNQVVFDWLDDVL
ncbi:MAG TPA: hypothetical protein VF843_03320, partial [Streptosporangiaceae bacterium]